MWIFSKQGFISVVQDRDDADVLHVRARVRDDLESIFPTAHVVEMPGADYLYRARVNRDEVANRLRDEVLGLSYDSHFKDVALETAPRHPGRHGAMYATWSAMAELQPFAPYSTTPRGGRGRWFEDEEEYR